ncbi:MAG: histidine triad nucleotide-binding protein [Selenomonadaceae bacterium]|nr:histidine triad nucleotide-binding protein [Selenomonadaceae bacterium]
MSDCIFCKIVGGEIKTDFIYEDETVVAFRDLNPQAPEHILIVPKKHVAKIIDFSADDKNLAAHIFVDVVKEIAKKIGVDEKGFRLVINTGEEGGQTVGHLHVHLIGGRKMTWPPG